ncbi:MAG: hypothetical protein M1834_006055 [Cirrosporium novae-zelandiae]|nr:MAG: hypothetical protein M1834_006055 [Cirrosporium novae-zelandiae]
MAQPRVLLLGGHGKVALLMTPLFLARSWHVISVIRDPAQKAEILQTGEGKPGKVEVLVESLENTKSERDARRVIDQVKPNYVVWSAGAGGKGGSERTYAIDRDAAKYYVSSSIGTPSVTKFLMISYLGSRRNRPPWWNGDAWTRCQHVNEKILPHYFKAKVAADEHLASLANTRSRDGDNKFQAICLRPGTLTDNAATGKVALGKTGYGSTDRVTRADVADVAVQLLARDDTHGWLDLLNGDEDIPSAIERVVREKIDCIEGE